MKSTKNLGPRRKQNLRLAPQTDVALTEMANLVGVPRNSVVAFAVQLTFAQFLPRMREGSFDLPALKKEILQLFGEAEHLRASLAAHARKA